MGLFDFFKKKPEETSEQKISDINIEVSIGSENISEFEGINFEYINQLYFVEEEQKQKLVKYIQALISYLEIDKTDSKNKLKYFLENKMDAYYNFESEYEDQYKEYHPDLSFPYFGWPELLKFKSGHIFTTKSNNINKESEIKWNDYKVELGFYGLRFNLINKEINGKDITSELDKLTKLMSEKYQLENCNSTLIKYFVKHNQFDKVKELAEFYVGKIEEIDYSKVEDNYCFIAFRFGEVGNNELELMYLNKAIDFVRENIKSPTKKDTGHSFRHLAEAFEKSGNKKKALEIAKEGLAFNDKLPLKRLISKLEK